MKIKLVRTNTAYIDPTKRKKEENVLFYANGEKAYKTCYTGVKRAYPMAEYKIVDGYGHLTYSMKNKDAYVKLVRSVCER